MSDLIASFPVLGQLPGTLLEVLQAGATPLSVPDGQVLIETGQACPGLAMLTSGCLRVVTRMSTGRELVLYRTRPSEICVVSVCCLLGSGSYPFSCLADGPVRGALVTGTVLREIVAGSEPFCRFVFQGCTERLTGMMGRIEEAAFHPLDRRLASLLLAKGYRIAATHQELAGALGSSREVVSRTLKRFADQGAVRLGRRRIEIANHAALREIAGNPVTKVTPPNGVRHMTRRGGALPPHGDGLPGGSHLGILS